MFGEPFLPPVTDGSGQDRALLRKAAQLLQEAGYAIKDGKRVLPKGEPITHRISARRANASSRITRPTSRNSRPLGFEATMRVVDPVQYRKRIDDFDFDIADRAYQRFFDAGRQLAPVLLSSQAAATKGSQNLAGISDPAVDALVDKIIAANNRAELTSACRALDRVLRAGRYWVPQWYQGLPLGSPIGTCSGIRRQAARYCARRAGHLVVRPATRPRKLEQCDKVRLALSRLYRPPRCC